MTNNEENLVVLEAEMYTATAEANRQFAEVAEELRELNGWNQSEAANRLMEILKDGLNEDSLFFQAVETAAIAYLND